MARQTVRDILGKSEEYLSGKGVDSPRLSAQLLAAFALGMDRMRLFLDLDRPLGDAELDLIRPLIARRGRGEPVAMIVGEKEFFCRPFAVCSETLTPRPETELLIEIVLERVGRAAAIRFADLGAGSGVLAVTVACELAGAAGVAVDVSPGALAAARANAERHGVASRIEFVLGDFGDVLAGGGYDVILTNPPYVSEAEYAGLSREVRDFESKSALVPGASGLEAYRSIAPAAYAALSPGGFVAAEIGWTQGEAVSGIFGAAGFESIRVRKDLAGLDRVVLADKPASTA
ncbi:MAG: peptide chain release factor N(5)-glutamine methyltransferase [Desulfovibrionaceae bacterium]|nr:peptide chain release factor N(5)-glutamine methyltransferase [Desulfovibrionaceae bacterium]MBF0513070.1 peptide chain release factor N(5)-glutamine methyltransferase [Desulfovibrionaceae bacterium]